jgi:hypothetical protein
MGILIKEYVTGSIKANVFRSYIVSVHGRGKNEHVVDNSLRNYRNVRQKLVKKPLYRFDSYYLNEEESMLIRRLYGNVYKIIYKHKFFRSFELSDLFESAKYKIEKTITDNCIIYIEEKSLPFGYLVSKTFIFLEKKKGPDTP